VASPPPIRSRIFGSQRVKTPAMSTHPNDPNAPTQKMISRADAVIPSRVSGTPAASAPARAAMSSNMIEPTPADSRANAYGAPRASTSTVIPTKLPMAGPSDVMTEALTASCIPASRICSRAPTRRASR
jgi:hypothetical protein